MKFSLLFIRNKPFIDKNGKLFGRYDLFVPLFFIIIVALGFFVARVVFQKDTYITAELYASGGEWWWNNPAPPYWLTGPLVKGATEYDSTGKKFVEVLAVQKFESGDRKMLWMKVRLLVTPINKAKQYRFRREPIQIGSLIYVAPNNIRVSCNVMSIEGYGEKTEQREKTVLFRSYGEFPWIADVIKVGSKMLNDDGSTAAEVLEKTVVPAEMTTVDYLGQTKAPTNPRRVDITLKVRMKTVYAKGRDYFSFFQPLKVGFFIWIPLENLNISGYITQVE
jgi:hypothetical protein